MSIGSFPNDPILTNKEKELVKETAKAVIEEMQKKPEKTTLVNIVLDCSASMSSIKESVISSFNEYIQSLRMKGGQFKVSLTTFSTTVNKRAIDAAELASVTLMTVNDYLPDGMTALYDAIGDSLSHVENVKGEMNVITVIITDGQENASKEYNANNIREMIQSWEKSGKSTFLYLGANQDAWAAGGNIGVRPGNSFCFTASASGFTSTMQNVAHVTKDYAMSINDGKATAATYRASMNDKPTIAE